MSRLARTRVELAEALQGGRPRVLVPTMGALHDGHRALVRRARAVADPEGVVVVSVFVNPLQFGSAQDLAGYPRTLDHDLVVCSDEGVDVVWAPSVDVMYPGGTPAVTVSSGLPGSVLEGASRPGHFDGVLTVVTKLFGQVCPDVAVFGAKDAQQVALVRRLVCDLDLPVTIETVDTVRAADGLALSSRNGRLTVGGRRAATTLPRALSAAAAAAPAGPASVIAAARAVLDAEPYLVLDYLALVDPETFAELEPGHVGAASVVVAGTVDGVRLIDNLTVACG